MTGSRESSADNRQVRLGSRVHGRGMGHEVRRPVVDSGRGTRHSRLTSRLPASTVTPHPDLLPGPDSVGRVESSEFRVERSELNPKVEG